MNEQADAAEWSYRLGDQTYGPLTLRQLQHAADTGLLPPHTALYNAGTGSSQPAGLVLRYGPVPSQAAGGSTGAGAKAAGCVTVICIVGILVLAAYSLRLGGLHLVAIAGVALLLVVGLVAGLVWLVTRRPRPAA